MDQYGRRGVRFGGKSKSKSKRSKFGWQDLARFVEILLLIINNPTINNQSLFAVVVNQSITIVHNRWSNNNIESAIERTFNYQIMILFYAHGCLYKHFTDNDNDDVLFPMRNSFPCHKSLPDSIYQVVAIDTISTLCSVHWLLAAKSGEFPAPRVSKIDLCI